MADNKFLQYLCSTQSVFWHDSAINSEFETALENGAKGITTNPFLVNATLQNDKQFWKNQLEAVPKDLKGDEKALALTKIVATHFSKKLLPMYNEAKKNNVKNVGYVCSQVNPAQSGNVDYMVKQAKTIATFGENVVIKLPATFAGLKAYEKCVSLGFNVAATVGFTVSQAVAFAKAQQRGAKTARANGVSPGVAIAVLMVGRLDDYLRDIAKDLDLYEKKVFETDITQSGIACIKKAYKIFKQQNYETLLMPAGCRGAYHISSLCGANMIMSVGPKIADQLAFENDLSQKIDLEVDQSVVERLLVLDEFKKAYNQDGLNEKEFMSFGVCNRTTTQFIECGWNLLY